MDLDFPHESLSGIIDGFPGNAASHPCPAPEDVAAVLYTSGTTGKPKGVMLTHGNVMATAYAKTEHVPIEPGERALCVLPLFHSGGLNDLAFPCIYRGATIILRQRFSASEFWDCVEQYKVNAIYIVPTMWNILLKAPEADWVDTSSLRFGVSGAAPIPPEQLRECEERFGIPILEGYGSTENTGGITVNQLGKSKWGSVGTALPGFDVRIYDDEGQSLPPERVGEIVVKADTVMKGYLNRPEATSETIQNGYLYTGDVGYMDKEGYLYIVDRKREVIIRGV
jgi:acyl-CoA synthetase (AMP-forming)/AMP-acid ligase II